MAPSAAADHTLSVVAWERRGDGAAPETPPEVLLDVANAHPPKALGDGNLGYVADAVSGDGDAYVALAVQVDERKPFGAMDRWEIICVTGLAGKQRGADGGAEVEGRWHDGERRPRGSSLSTLASGGAVALSGNKFFAPLGAETVTVSGVGIAAGA